MPAFAYTVQDAQGQAHTGVLEASNQDEAITSLQQKGMLILSIEEAAAKAGRKARFGRGGKVTGQDLVFFGEQLSTLINGGVPLVRAVTLLGENADNPALAACLSQVSKDLSTGSSLSKAMEKHPKVFDTLWVQLVAAGEASGQLPKTLKQVTAYTASTEAASSKIVTALMYPAVLFLMSVGVLAFFIIKVVPMFAEVFKSFNLELPALTKLVITFSTIISKNLLYIIVALAAGIYGLRSFLRTQAGLLLWSKFVLSVPLFGNIMYGMLLERMLSTLCTLLRSGVSVINALSILENIFGTNLIFQSALIEVRKEVTTGKSLSACFRKTGVFPALVTEMMAMGEESGKLPEMLETMAAFYAERTDQFMRRFTSLIDPIMIVGIGGVIVTIVMSIFLPVLKLSQVKM